MLASGSQPWANIGNENVVRPTGCYLAPGSIGEVTVPQALLDKGIKIRVGAHYWNLDNKSTYKRLDRVSIVYDVNELTTLIANPLGGGIYLEVPLGVDEGLVEITFKNVVRSPFFSQKSFHQTTLDEWLTIERNHPAPWADFETDKFMMQVPTGWIYNFDDPQSLLEEWDKSMDIVSDLLGRPKVADRHKNYLQFDVVIRGGAYHPGYPMSNTPYNPNATFNGLPQHAILNGPQYGQDVHFHELGHEVAISKFAGETEATVNLLYVPVLNKGYGFSLNEAFYLSFADYWPYLPSTRDNITRTRLISDTFHEGQERNICNCTKNEVRYQHRGYAHYVDIAELFGWEALESFWQSESDAADVGTPFPVNDQDKDDRIFRMSQAAGVDLRPLFHFWGIHPENQDELAQRMADNDLELSDVIKCRLHEYRQLIPADYDAFVAFTEELYPDFLNYSGTNFDYGAGWFYVTAQTYDEAKANKIDQALTDILTLYYGNAGSVPALNLECLGISIPNNAGVVGLEGLDEAFCGSINFTPVVEFGNFSQDEMTSASFELYVNGVFQQSLDWTGSLNTLEYSSLTFDELLLTETTEVEVRITSVNGTTDGNDSDNFILTEIREVTLANSFDLTLAIQTDNYPNETSWDFRDADGNIFAEGSGYTEQNTLYETAVTIPDNGCYTFNVYDSYGDGICCGFGIGYYQLLDPDGNILFEGGEFDDSYSEMFGVEALTPPIAGFSADAIEGCLPFTVNFTNESSNNTTDFSWEFEGGDPATSTDENPSSTWNAAGTYTVTLTASNGAGSSTSTSTITVNDVPTSNFISDINGADVDFTNNSTNADSYSWDFGDGNSSTEADPSHTYIEDGVYTVILISTNACGSTISTMTVTIVVTNQEQISNMNELLLYPVPVSDKLNIRFSLAEPLHLDVRLFNTLGQDLGLVASKACVDGMNTLEIDVSQFSDGIYFIQFSIGAKQRTMKFTILK
jgi:PKD repeat protein